MHLVSKVVCFVRIIFKKVCFIVFFEFCSILSFVVFLRRVCSENFVYFLWTTKLIFRELDFFQNL